LPFASINKPPTDEIILSRVIYAIEITFVPEK